MVEILLGKRSLWERDPLKEFYEPSGLAYKTSNFLLHKYYYKYKFYRDLKKYVAIIEVSCLTLKVG